jgi:hypothetical protein
MGCTLFVCWAGFTVTVAAPALLVSWVEVAVIVTCSEVTPPDGAVNKPELEMVPALAVHVTPELKLPVPITVAEHWLVWPYRMVEGEQLTLTEVIVEPGFTVTVTVPDLLVSCVEVAVIVTCSDVAPPDGAVNKPELEIVPALAVHVTPELKLPVPVTVAEH